MCTTCLKTVSALSFRNMLLKLDYVLEEAPEQWLSRKQAEAAGSPVLGLSRSSASAGRRAPVLGKHMAEKVTLNDRTVPFRAIQHELPGGEGRIRGAVHIIMINPSRHCHTCRPPGSSLPTSHSHVYLLLRIPWTVLRP